MPVLAGRLVYLLGAFTWSSSSTVVAPMFNNILLLLIFYIWIEIFLARHPGFFNMKVTIRSVKQKSTLKIFTSNFSFKSSVKLVYYGNLSQKNAFLATTCSFWKKLLKNWKVLSVDASVAFFLVFSPSNDCFSTFLP